ncbi:DegT/DnrJ/EryC1/StrS family aminotransferase [Luteibacter aegosomatissinici]|uniref:DegT/DnrJ/EryC1/StrS family aminotransferase n=1 Tax=Luteibacter aegosomatissinici TaxID=2911539 RepID=UPI001FF85B8A|nr:DegT/DnrJ/EryC1/StrS family aminotransferase [Luteibacter aegosomatissinici]UPG93569.1 DegT/DnrJ/EryC1/StrS family aminotransferase [Luteibacter aegosomatissinici]
MWFRPEREAPPTAGLPLGITDLGGEVRAPLTALAAQWLGVEEAQLECSGTAALTVALTALSGHARSRRDVVIPAFTCPLVPLAIRRAGLEPRLVDLRAGHFDMDPVRLAEACNERTLAIVPTHLGGRVADVATAKAVAAATGAYVVEDAAQAFGAFLDGRAAGTHGDVGFFSLAAGKGLSIFEGGLLVARDDAVRDSIRRTSRRIAGWHPGWELRRTLELAGYAAFYRPRGLGMAYGGPLRRALRRGDLLGAAGEHFGMDFPLHRVGRWRRAVGARAFHRLPLFIETTTTQARARVPALASIPGVHVYSDDSGTWPYLMLLLPDESTRDAVLQRLWASRHGVARMFVHALPDYPYLAPMAGGDDVPNAREFAARTLTVTNSPWLDDASFEHVCAVIEATVVSRGAPAYPATGTVTGLPSTFA